MVDWGKCRHECDNLTEIIAEHKFETFVQPIRSLGDNSIFGYEVFNRPKHYDVEAFYTKLGTCKCVNIIDLYLLQSSLHKIQGLHERIFFNIFPNTLSDILDDSIELPGVVLELSERQPFENIELWSKVIRESNYTIALDDIGKGFTRSALLVEEAPHFMKLDKLMVQHIDHSDLKKSLVSSYLHYAKGKSVIIAEGIERQEELDALIELGVQYGQGYLLGKPFKWEENI